MANFNIPTGIILIAVVAIIAYLLYTNPSAPVLPSHDFTNWTGYNGLYSGSVTGKFVGTVGTRAPDKWTNMAGVFDGTCNVQGQVSDCYLNISSGQFVGTVTSGVLRDTLTANLSGTATWDVRGYWRKYETAPVAPANNNLQIGIILALAAVGGYYIYTQKSYKRTYLNNTKITNLLKKELKEGGWGTDFLKAESFTPISDVGESPREVRIHFLVTKPYKKSWLASYNFTTGNIDIINTNPSPMQVDEYMVVKIKYIEQRVVPKKFEKTEGKNGVQ